MKFTLKIQHDSVKTPDEIEGLLQSLVASQELTRYVADDRTPLFKYNAAIRNKQGAFLGHWEIEP